MKTKFTFSILCTVLFGALSAQGPSWEWAKRVGSFNDNAPFATGDQNERFNDIKVDAAGNVYAVGEFFQNSAFNNSATGFPTTGGYGERDAYLMKFDRCGKTLWWRRMGGTGYDWAVSLVLDTNGRVVISGYCSPTFTLGGSNIVDTVISSSGTLTSFIARFDTTGNFIDRFNGFGFGGNLFITSQADYFVVAQGFIGTKVSTFGNTIGTYSFVASNSYAWVTIRGVALDKSDNVYLTGYYTGTVNIGGTTITTTNQPNGVPNSVLAKFSPTGSLVWINTSTPNGVSADRMGRCTIDTSGTVLATAATVLGTVTVFGYSVTTPPPGSTFGGYANVFFYFNTNSGNLISAVTATTQWGDIVAPCHTDKNNNIHCAGTMNGYLQFNTGTFSTNPVSTTRQSFIAKLDLSGNLLNGAVVPQSGSNNGTAKEGINGLVTDTIGNVYIAGMFGGTLDSLGTQVNIIGGSEDGFIAKYGYPCGAAPSGSVPNTPLVLAAVNNSLTNNVTWTDNSNNETNFELHYTIGANPNYSLLATLPANTTSYPHTGLSHTTTYCYKVAATNSLGMSAFSNTDCTTTPAAPTSTSTQAPNAPLNLAAVNNGSLTNNVTWTDNSNDETNFELHYGMGSNPTYSLLATLPANTTAYPHSGLSHTTTYCYKVAATNSVGSSAFSNSACASTPGAPGDTTGIADVDSKHKNMICFPNPASTEIYFALPGNEKQADIEIYNALGGLIFNKKGYMNRSAIDISAFSNGLYYYKIWTGRIECVGKVVKE